MVLQYFNNHNRICNKEKIEHVLNLFTLNTQFSFRCSMYLKLCINTAGPHHGSRNPSSHRPGPLPHLWQSFNHAFVFAKFSLLFCGCVSYNDCIYHLFCASTKLYAWACPKQRGKGRRPRPAYEGPGPVRIPKPKPDSRPRAQPIFNWDRSIWPSALIFRMFFCTDHQRVLRGVFERFVYAYHSSKIKDPSE